MKIFIPLTLLSVGIVASAKFYTEKTADVDFLQKQKKVFDLLAYVGHYEITDAEWYEIGRNYDIFKNFDLYTNKDLLKEFKWKWEMGMLHKDALFTYYKKEHREEMYLLYKLFYFAKDFETFYKTASWARMYMNYGLFTAAFSTAVIHRHDTKYIRLPAIYEIYPNAYFSSRVMHDAQQFKMMHGGYGSSPNFDMETYHVYSNYTEFCWNPTYDFNYEYKMNYFMEDIGLNSWYYYFRMAYPFWMNSKDFNFPSSFRGEFYWFFHQQLMARYYNERVSNGFGEIPGFTWDHINMPGYYSDLTYWNGLSMPKREWWDYVPYYKHKYFDYLKKIDDRIFEAIDSGYFYDNNGKQMYLYGPEGLNWLGNIIEGNSDSLGYKYYGSYDSLFRDIFGMSFDTKCKNYYVPSSLDYFSTSLRDPAFYRMYHKIVEFFHRYKANINKYTSSELEYPGIKLEKVEMDKLFTYFDYKNYYINNAVGVKSWKDGKSFNIKAWQHFLNYKPFNYKFTVNSDKDARVMVRIFLGPAIDSEKYDDFSYLNHYYKYFYMLDEFDIQLKAGVNNLERPSGLSSFYKSEHFINGDEYYKKIMNALEGSEPFTYNEKMWGFPSHLMLPKGTPEGMRYKLFFYIGPWEDVKEYEMPIFGKFNYFGKAFGFPLDRPMEPWFFKLKNMYLKDITIYHLKDHVSKYGNYY